MNRRLRTRLRLPVLYLGLLALTLLSGCQGHTVIARVNGDPILQDEYYDRLQRVTSNDLTRNTPGLDAGGSTIVSMTQEKLLDQLAAKDHTAPSEEWLRTLATFLQRKESSVAVELAAGPDREATFLQQLKEQREEIGIGTNASHVDPKDVHEEYDKQKGQALLYPEMFTINLLVAQTQAQAQQAYDVVKRTGDFVAAGQAIGQAQAGATPRPVVIAVDPLSKQATLYFSSQQQLPIPADYVTTLRGLSAGQTAMKEVTLTPPSTQGVPPTPQTVYFVAKLLSKQPSGTATEADATPYLEMTLLTQHFPEWQRHFLQELVDFTHSSSIQINITRYRPLLTYLQNMQQQNLASAISNAINAAPPPGSGATPPGGGTAAPEPGTAPPGRATTPPLGSSPRPGGKTGPSGGPG